MSGVKRAVAALQGATVSLNDAEINIPAKRGIYAWWMKGAPIADVPAPPHPFEADLRLVYIGIAPNGEGSKSTLRSCILRNHIKGNLAASTLRRTLASLLVGSGRKWTPLKSGNGGNMVVFSPEHNKELTEWQRVHLRLTWHEVAAPWEIEAEVIREMKPPFNLDDNDKHPFFERLSDKRRRLKLSAR